MYSAVEQAIKAGIEAIQERDNRIAALEAQLAERVKVKLLEWVQDNDGGCFYAETELGIYIAWDNGRVQYGNFRVSFVDGGSVGARSKAQADYERRILSALEATPPAPKAELWTGEGDGFKSFTLSAKVAERWRKGSLKVTPYASLSGDAS